MMTTNLTMKLSKTQILQTHLPMPSLQKSKSIHAVMVTVVTVATEAATVVMAAAATITADTDTKSPRTGGQVSSRIMAKKV